MTDDGIREHHGMACRKEHEKHSSVAIWEGEQYIWIDHDSMDDRKLTPTQARYLARKLYRLARRIDGRATEE